MSLKILICTLAALELCSTAVWAEAADEQSYWVGAAVAEVPLGKQVKPAAWSTIAPGDADGAFDPANVRGLGNGTSMPGRPVELASTVARPLFVPNEGGAFLLTKATIGWALEVSVKGKFVVFHGFVAAVAPSPSGVCQVSLDGRIPYRENQSYVWRGRSEFGRAGLPERVVVVTLRPCSPAL